MAELATLARPYSRAAFEFANGAGELQPWYEALATSAVVTGDSGIKSLLASPSLTAEQKSKALNEVLGKDTIPGFANFISTLATNSRLSLLPVIFEMFAQMKSQREKSVEVLVISAFEVDKQLQEKLTTALKNALEREVLVTSEVDASLLGGAVIRAGDTVIDGSVRGRLTKLAETMNA